MKDIEELFQKKQSEVNSLQAPPQLEERLRNALSTKKRKKGNRWIAVILIGVLLFSYHFDAIAFYSKKILGYEEIMSETLRDLNELGAGQDVNKSYTFKNGMVVTIEGIMVDHSQLLLFYTIRDPKGKIEDADLHMVHYNTWLGGYHINSGQGILSEDNKEIKNIATFDPPKAFTKTLRFSFPLRHEENYEEGVITVQLDRRKAMGFRIKQRINQTMIIDGSRVHFETIIATPTQTIVSGSIGSPVDLVKEVLSGERARFEIETEIFADGEPINQLGGGMRTDSKGITFHSRFDALPKEIKSLEISLKELTKTKDIKEELEIEPRMEAKRLSLEGQDVLIEKVEVYDNNTFVTINTKEDVIFRKIYLEADGKQIPLDKMLDSQLDKLENGEIRHRRKLQFLDSGEELKLLFRRICYTSEYGKRIQIPIQ
ncbi:MAG: DUF4179 domain-containing protein [Thermotaleaceae bacterium]